MGIIIGRNVFGSPPQEEQRSCFIRALQACCFIPQRYVLGIMGLLGVCNAYTMRVCLNFAITQMVKHRVRDGQEVVDPNACPVPLGVERLYSGMNHQFDWDEPKQGLLLGGFYWGYATTQVLGGYLAERYGGKWTLGIGLLSTALFTFLTPPVVKIGGAPALFILRVVQGMGEGPTMPALMIMLAKWVPPNERSFIGAIVFGGAQIGNIFGCLMSGILLDHDRDWCYVFYFFGGFGLIWFSLWADLRPLRHGGRQRRLGEPISYSQIMLCYSTPATHPYIKPSELSYLNEHVLRRVPRAERDPIPWKAILRSAPVWALVWASVGHDWGYYTMVTDLPKYTHDVLRFDIKTAGILNALPYIAMWMSSIIFGYLCDLCIRKKWHSIKTGRILYTAIAAGGPAVAIIMASYAGCNHTMAITYFVISMALMGSFYAGMKVNPLDLAPNHAGILTSIVNTIATFGGIATPWIIGLLTPDSTLYQWRIAFWVCFVVLIVTNLGLFWADGKQQWWDDVYVHGYPEGWNHGPLATSGTHVKQFGY